MKKIYSIFAVASLLAFTTACDLELYPETGYNEGNVKVDEDGGETSQYTTKEEMQNLLKGIYNNNVRDIQEKGWLDWLVYTECRADNAYGGNPATVELMDIESNAQDGANLNVKRDWSWYQVQMSATNQIIYNIDRIKESDPSFTEKEWGEIKAQAYCWKAWNLFQMSQIWGDIPVINTIPPAITPGNLEEVYPEYFPARTAREEVYKQIIEELEFAVLHAPDVDKSNKMLFTKAFAHGMLARVYAEKTLQDWSKVAEHCAAVEGMGYELCDNYGDMWAYDETDATRNTKESIFEVTWTRDEGNWLFMMFHRNAYNPGDSFTWIKWVTPSRNLIAAYDREGDTERKNASIIFDQCNWNNYYLGNEYAFMHKLPTNASSVILMRLGEIYLLHAEALAELGQFAEATNYINKVRERAKLAKISVPGSQEEMLDAVLNERRLELAFEGFRFFDLVRHDKAKEVHDKMPTTDKYWKKRFPLTEETILMPIPQEALEQNPSLVQNAGY